MMAKTMASIENGTVVNLLWCADAEPQTDTLVQVNDIPVGIGDTYDGMNFYRAGERLLTPMEEVLKENAELSAQNDTLVDDMAQLVEEVYQSDLEMMTE